MPSPADAGFDWGDESQLHRFGRGAMVALAFVGVFLLLASFTAVVAFATGHVWISLAVILVVGAAVELLVLRSRRS